MLIANSHGTTIPADPAAAAAAPTLLTGHVAQDQSNWCWAACFQMVRSCLKLPPMSQLEMASAYFGAQNCTDPTSTSCNAAAFLDEADTDCGLYCTAGGRLPLSVIQDEIVGRQRPVALQIEKPGVVGHVVLVVGCAGDRLDIHDPRAGHVKISFAALQAGYDGGTWTRSFSKFGAIGPASDFNA